MVKAAAANGWIDEKAIVIEMLTRHETCWSGFNYYIFSKDVARWLDEKTNEKGSN